MNATAISSALSEGSREGEGGTVVQMDCTSSVSATGDITSAHFRELVLLLWAHFSAYCMGVFLRRWCCAELTAMLLNRLWWSIPVEFAWQSSVEIGKRHQTAVTVVQMSLLLVNYTRAHFSHNEILNGVMRTSSPLCITELYKVMDLNGNSLLALMKHEKNSQFTQRGRVWEGGVKW